MSKTKMAPVLTVLMDDLRREEIQFPMRHEHVGNLQILRLARDEVRALKAVARAAHVVEPGTRRCAASCPCRRGLRAVADEGRR